MDFCALFDCLSKSFELYGFEPFPIHYFDIFVPIHLMPPVIALDVTPTIRCKFYQDIFTRCLIDVSVMKARSMRIKTGKFLKKKKVLL